MSSADESPPSERRAWITMLVVIGLSLAFGLVTPPYGLCLMIACSVAGMRVRDALKDTLIMLVPLFLVLALVILWPAVSLLLPSLVSPEFLR